MYLSECVLEEVYTHIRGTYYEFIKSTTTRRAGGMMKAPGGGYG